jgi:hypothetical protein
MGGVMRAIHSRNATKRLATGIPAARPGVMLVPQELTHYFKRPEVAELNRRI